MTTLLPLRILRTSFCFSLSFTAEEDHTILQHVKQYGDDDLNLVASSLGRPIESCTRRWHTLDPNTSTTPWSPELFMKVKESCSAPNQNLLEQRLSSTPEQATQGLASHMVAMPTQPVPPALLTGVVQVTIII